MSGMRPAQARGPFVGSASSGTPGPPGPPGPAGGGTWVKTTVGFASLQSASLQNSFSFYSLPGTYDIQRALMTTTARFTGTSITSITASIGISGDLEQLAPQWPLDNAVASSNLQYSNNGILYDLVAATNILITVYSTGANLSALATGSVDIYLFVTNLNNL